MQQTLELLQKQKQILTQKQIQSLTILAMDNVELDCFLPQEYLDNPMLEGSERISKKSAQHWQQR